MDYWIEGVDRYVDMLTVSTWMWGKKFTHDHVNRLRKGVERHLKQPYHWRVFHPEARDIHLTKIPGCFARLRMFDPEWQRRNGIEDRLVNLDLDTIITGPLDELFDRPEPFVIMQGANAVNPCPMNGALMMLTPGVHPEVWNDFSVEAAKKVPFFSFPDDQGWIWHKLPDAAGWKVGNEHGIYVYKKRGWPNGTNELPQGAKLVTFINSDPSQMTHLGWVRENWK